MTQLTSMPNIGSTLSVKLEKIGVTSKEMLEDLGSENAIIRIATLDNRGVCINMLYALEGAIQGIRWNSLSSERKAELLDFFNSLSSK